MSKTDSKEGLLQSCVQDLHAARQVAIERLPCVEGESGDELAGQLKELRQALSDEAERLAATDISLEGPENLWMAGVMEDAERDTRSVERGPLLDVALIGAVRKGVAADAVSIETAVAVAQALDRQDLADLLQAMRERAERSDNGLRTLLRKIA